MRMRRLYRIHLLVFVLYGALAFAAGATFLPGEAARLGWDFLLADPKRAMPGALAMLYQPELMGILPVFVWCMLLLPGFAWALGRLGRQGDGAAGGVLRCGVGVRAGLAERGPGRGHRVQSVRLADPVPGRRLAGAAGAAAMGALPFRSPAWRAALWAALAVLGIGLALRLAWYGWTPWPAPFGELLLG